MIAAIQVALVGSVGRRPPAVLRNGAAAWASPSARWASSACRREYLTKSPCNTDCKIRPSHRRARRRSSFPIGRPPDLLWLLAWSPGPIGEVWPRASSRVSPRVRHRLKRPSCASPVVPRTVLAQRSSQTAQKFRPCYGWRHPKGSVSLTFAKEPTKPRSHVMAAQKVATAAHSQNGRPSLGAPGSACIDIS